MKRTPCPQDTDSRINPALLSRPRRQRFRPGEERATVRFAGIMLLRSRDEQRALGYAMSSTGLVREALSSDPSGQDRAITTN